MKRLLMAAALALAAAPAQADDTLLLRLNGSGVTGEADTVAAGWGHNHYRGYGSHYGYGSRYGYGYAPRYYAPRYSFGFNFGFGYGRPYASYYRPHYGYYRSFYSYATPYYCPIGYDVDTFALPEGNVSYSVVRPRVDGVAPPVTPQPTPERLPAPRDGTFRYDGGPANPVPMPPQDAAPAPTLRLFDRTPETRPVSLPARSGKLVYPAYGERPN